MDIADIPLDKAELLSVILEALLYGFSLLMFGGTIWTLLFQRSTRLANRRMFTVACALLLFSTAHLVIDIIRVMEGLILYRDTYLGGPVAFFSNVSQWTFVAKNYVFTAQTLVGDGVVLYRCYVVWQSKLVMVLPVLLWSATIVTGIGSPYTCSRVTQNEVFSGSISQWITSFWATALATNLLTTLLLVCRIWYIDRKATKLRGHQQSQLKHILHILVDAGAIYSLSLLVALICFVSRSNGQFVILDLVTPIISITFYMVIIRVGLATRAAKMTDTAHGSMSMETGLSTRRRTMQVHVTTLTESKVEHGRRSSISFPKSGKSIPSEIKLDNRGPGGEV